MSQTQTQDSDTNSVKSCLALIDRWLAFQVYYQEIPSISVGIQLGERVLFKKSYGYADLAHKKQATPQTLYRIASHTKLFTATAIMKLYSLGKLGIDDKVNSYLPWFKSNTNKTLDDIRIRHLLSHTSGISRDGNFGHWFTDDFPGGEQIQTMLDQGFSIFQPSERLKYSNIAYALLGMIIQQVSGESYEAHIQKLLAELGMTQSQMDINQMDININNSSTHAIGYGMRMPNQAREIMPAVSAKALNSAAGLSSNVEDLLRFFSAHYLGNQMLFADSIKREMQKSQFRTSPNEWALGFELLQTGGLSYISHGGAYPGFITRSGLNQKHKLIIVVLSNAIDGPANQLFNGISSIIEHQLNNQHQYETQAINNIAEVCGYYQSRWKYFAFETLANTLVSINPASINPLDQLQVYKHLDEQTFNTVAAGPMASAGEKIQFSTVAESGMQFHFSGNVASRCKI